MEIFRGAIFHTPRNPFREAGTLTSFSDGGLAVADGCVAACGDYAEVRRAHPEAEVHDLRGGFVLPGFADTHVHFPQVRVMGSLGEPLLDWLAHRALPEEAKMADAAYAREVAGEFLRGLASHGTTSALVFGAHFEAAMEMFFTRAGLSGLRIASGLVVSDRGLRPELHITADEAYARSTALIRRFHGVGRVRYAVTPRFAVSASEAMLEACQTLLAENPGVMATTHINENPAEIAEVARLFPWSRDYLAVYEKYGLADQRSVLAHNVHTSDDAIARLAAGGAAVAHCPCSNAALGSGVFPLRRHVEAGVRVALGTDVGAGTGFSMMKEAMQAYLLQRAVGGAALGAAHLLYLATKAGTDAMGLDGVGDFGVGGAADFVHVKPPAGSALESIERQGESAERVLAAVFTLAGSECVAGTWVGGRRVWSA